MLKLWASDHARCEGGGAKPRRRREQKWEKESPGWAVDIPEAVGLGPRQVASVKGGGGKEFVERVGDHGSIIIGLGIVVIYNLILRRKMEGVLLPVRALIPPSISDPPQGSRGAGSAGCCRGRQLSGQPRRVPGRPPPDD